MDSYTHHRFSGNNFVNEIHRMLWLGALGHNDPLQKDPSSEIWQREDRTEIEAQRHLSSGLLTRKFTVMNGGESILTYTTWGDLSPEGKRHFDQLGLGYVQAGTRRTTIVSMDKERSVTENWEKHVGSLWHMIEEVEFLKGDKASNERVIHEYLATELVPFVMKSLTRSRMPIKPTGRPVKDHQSAPTIPDILPAHSSRPATSDDTLNQLIAKLNF